MLCFGVVRPYKGVDVLLEAFREVEGAELWVVGRPLGVSMERCAGSPRRQRALRAALRERRRAARLLSPRRPAGAAAPQASTCRECCSPAWPSARRWCSPTWAASARWSRTTARAGWWRRATRRRCAPPSASCSPTRRAREPWRSARRAAAAGPYSWDRIAERTLGVYAQVLAREGRVHGQEQALGGARRSSWLVGQGCEVAAVVASEPDRWTRDEQRVDLVARAARAAARERGRALRRRRRRTSTWSISFLFWRLIREPLISLGGESAASTSTPRPCPTSAAWAATTWRSSRACPSGACPATSWTSASTRATWSRWSAFRSTPTAETAFSLDLQSQERLLASSSDVIGRLLAGEELPRAPQGEGRYVTARGVRGAAPGPARATTSRASCGPSGIRPSRARCSRWTGAASRWSTSACWERSPQAYRDAGPAALSLRNVTPVTRRRRRGGYSRNRELRGLRYGESGWGSLLHGLRRAASSAAAPPAARPAPPDARFCMSCGHGARRGRRPAPRPAPAASGCPRSAAR